MTHPLHTTPIPHTDDCQWCGGDYVPTTPCGECGAAAGEHCAVSCATDESSRYDVVAPAHTDGQPCGVCRVGEGECCRHCPAYATAVASER